MSTDVRPPAENAGGAVTMSDVAKLAGVSVKTVSNVVNNYVHVRASTRARVQAALDELGYQMNFAAQSLRKGRTGIIGLAVPDLRNPYFAEFAQALMVHGAEMGLTILVELTEGRRTKELESLEHPLRTMTDGLLMYIIGLSQADAKELEVDFPLILLGDRIFEGPFAQVTMANSEALRAITHRLYASGARRIAVVGDQRDGDSSTPTLRLQGYRQALEELGVEYDPDLVFPVEVWDRQDGARATEQALREGAQFDALIGLNDVLAIGALHALHANGLVVPDDVQVVGFDNLNEAQYSTPSLTTVDPGVSMIARDSLELISRMIDGAPIAGGGELIVESFRIVERESTRPIPRPIAGR